MEKKEVKLSKTKFVAVTGLGIALYVAMSLCLQVPVFENYYLCLGYVAMAVYCYSFGTLSGTLVGTVGCLLYCLLINGMRGMPGWIVGNLIIGIVMGLTFRMTKKMSKKAVAYVIQIAAIIVSVAVAMLVAKSVVECLLYAQPFALRAAKNLYAFVSDTFMLVVSLPLCPLLDKAARKIFK